MRNYSDPKMSIAMFDAENVVTKASDGLVGQATQEYFNNKSAGTTALANATVATKNILNFTETK